MDIKAKTDRELSISAAEFVWEEGGQTESNRLLALPVTRLLKRHASRAILDLGCGNGALTAHIHAQGLNITGCDYSKSGIELARKQYPDLRFFQHDIQQPLPPEHTGCYDTVISCEVIEHLLLPRTLMGNARSALRPGGLFILTTPYHGYWKNLALALSNGFDRHWHPLRDYGHIKFFSRKTIIRLFEEFDFRDMHPKALGRIPPFACSMLVHGKKMS